MGNNKVTSISDLWYQDWIERQVFLAGENRCQERCEVRDRLCSGFTLHEMVILLGADFAS